eukprot:6050-Heterococcus_DN1.PRE.9
MRMHAKEKVGLATVIAGSKRKRGFVFKSALLHVSLANIDNMLLSASKLHYKAVVLLSVTAVEQRMLRLHSAKPSTSGTSALLLCFATSTTHQATAASRQLTSTLGVLVYIEEQPTMCYCRTQWYHSSCVAKYCQQAGC